MFLAIAYKAHVPFKMAEHLVHLLAGATIAWASIRVSGSRIVGVVLFSVIALDPAYLGGTAARVTRDGLYGSLCLLLIGTVVLSLSFVPGLVRHGARWWLPLVFALGVIIGFIAAAYYTTRDERIWLVPSVLVAVAAGVATWRGGRQFIVRVALVTLMMFVVGGVTAMLCLQVVSSRNSRFYGTDVVSDVVDGEIARAYSQWQRVRTGDEQDYIPVNRSQREAVYAISSSAAELQPSLEEPGWWRGCSEPTCEIVGGAFVWAMRDAALEAGHYRTGAETQRFFGEIADDIERGM